MELVNNNNITIITGEKVLIFEHIWDQRDVKNISSVVIHHSIAADGTEISLPCGVSDPSTKVTLQRITSSKKDLINQTILPVCRTKITLSNCHKCFMFL